jgi:hypothetical protein
VLDIETAGIDTLGFGFEWAVNFIDGIKPPAHFIDVIAILVGFESVKSLAQTIGISHVRR